MEGFSPLLEVGRTFLENGMSTWGGRNFFPFTFYYKSLPIIGREEMHIYVRELPDGGINFQGRIFEVGLTYFFGL